MPLPVMQQSTVPNNPSQVEMVVGFPHGLNTNTPPVQLEKTECSALTNFKILKNGSLQTRGGIVKKTGSALASSGIAKYFCVANINGTDRRLIVDDNYELYYMNGTTPTSIGTLEGDAEILPYKGVALLLDGSYIKYIDGVSEIKIAYDNGSGTSGYQFNNRTGDDDDLLALGNGTNTRIATKFTSQAWDSGYTIPPTTVYAKLQREGNGYTGSDDTDITAVLRLVSTDAVQATKTLISAPIATNLSATATEYSVTFTSGDITTEMGPSTDYYMSIEYDNGDGTNYVHVRTTTVSSAGTAYYYTGSWSQSTTNDPLMGLKPGRPPKGSFGEVHGQRPFIKDPDNPGWARFGNLTYLDWSTSDGGGYVGAVDDDANSFEIGGMKSIYGDLYVIGTKTLPYLCKLTGDSPSDYSLPTLYQRADCTSKTLVNAINDLWMLGSNGIDSLRGVQEYGDLRSFSYSDPVDDRVTLWQSSSSICGYHPKDGQLFVQFPSYPKTLVCHIRNPVEYPGGTRFPWSEYEFCNGHLSDTDQFKWTQSSLGSTVWYLEDSGGGEPSLDKPGDDVTLDGQILQYNGTVASLTGYQWGYGDEDTLGYSTFYISLTSGDPTDYDIRNLIIPTCFGVDEETIVFGASTGYLYEFDDDLALEKDLDAQNINYEFKSKYFQFPFDFVTVSDIRVDVSANVIAVSTEPTLDLDVLVNGEHISERYSVSLTIPDPWHPGTGYYAPSDHDEGYTYKRGSISLRSIMFRLNNILPQGFGVTIKGLSFRFKRAKIYSTDDTFDNDVFILDATLGDLIGDGTGEFLEES